MIAQDKWIKYENGRFVGAPQTLKGTTGVWAHVVYLNTPTIVNKTETRIKDPDYDICYIRYLPQN